MNQLKHQEQGNAGVASALLDKVQGQTQLSLVVGMAEGIWMGAKERPVRVVVLQWEFVTDALTRERMMFSPNSLRNPLYH